MLNMLYEYSSGKKLCDCTISSTRVTRVNSHSPSYRYGK